MTVQIGKLLKDNSNYSFVQSEDKKLLLFNWKHVAGLSIQVFQRGISKFAEQCKRHKPTHAVIDARALDQGSPAVAWLRSQDVETTLEDYMTWWTREVLPVYQDAGISSLAVATGDPNAPGELTSLPPEVRFKMGYFPDLETSLDWKPE
ncbi:hypothetical protein [Pelagibius sp. Alg239-R121]|uniref:hypothetical protein n=1 Tax=Pelagibius sp. Alg239-R121 TaxID=2993448 RepID=UPI0024A78B3F|nr:hypothetical protein [Pelagibius sp. Alg239-R121]